MQGSLPRRRVMQGGAGLAALAALGIPRETLAQAASRGQLTIAFPVDVPTWDPNARTLAAVQSLYKCVFDQPLDQNPDTSPRPGVVTAWRWRDNGLALELDLRDDVLFHDGSRLTADDIRYTFFERPRQPVPQGGRRLDTSFLWRKLSDVEVASPTRAVMRFSEVMPSAVAWLYFLASFVVPKAHVERVGLEAFGREPIGSGPYRLREYQQGARIVLEANDRYWGGRPAIPRVTFELVRDPTVRVAAIEGRRVELSVDTPIRETLRLNTVQGLAARVDPTADIVILQITNRGGFADARVRLAAHHAIDKAAISRALYGGNAVPISVPAARGTPGYPADFDFPFSVERATALLREAGHGPQNPVNITFSTTNGFFPNDFDLSRAIVQMWRRVGINAELETIEPTTYQERLRAQTLHEATIFQWGNAAGDPEMYGGYLLDPNSIFSAFKAPDLAEPVRALLTETNEERRMAGYRALHRTAVERGYSIPLLQGVRTVAHQQALAYQKYDTGHILPHRYAFRG
jgi:peptide/nickel transport system substrate-binding protein